ncbi:ORF60 [Ictalurid herpesvirus 1]|uniref:Uncharacterized protein ORF60 n=1 Tax=Ictalurid herpesvirus 1 (strain Auburn) TaxID=766178 RepID=VG60_ICHVA|nr:ORF60 [Ictalurid herpesvirus 1]Q00125.1 RecName: Full=Uncharacterized protein ORF60 [Ictalurid herpesvirus 1 (strain Auburn)]AAA88163.1 ORF60 [Ictalurid herpesvirus 1]
MMILSKARCVELLEMPIETINGDWRFKASPHVTTRGVTEGVALLHMNSVRVVPGKGVVSRVDRANDFLSFLYHDISRISAGTCEPRESMLAVILPIDKVEEYVAKFRRVEPFTMGGFREACRALKFSAAVGTIFDRIMKDIFNRSPTLAMDGIPPLAKGLCFVLKSRGITPIRGGLLVGEIPKACGDHCPKCGAQYATRKSRFVTEIDLVGFDSTDNTCVLIEVKTYKNSVLPIAVLKKYNTQTWINWFLFGLMYPHLRQYTKSLIAVVSPAGRVVQLFNVRSPPITRRMISAFPFLGEYCPQMRRMMTAAAMTYVIKAPFVAAHVTGTDNVSIEVFSQSNKLPPNKWATDDAARREMERTRKARYRAKNRAVADPEDSPPGKRLRRGPKSST